MEHITNSAEETKKFGKEISASLKGGEVLALTGDLGFGKTTFVQGLAEGLAIDVRVISPTFIIVRKYIIPLTMKLRGIKNFYHIDLYRLEGAIESELVNLGVKDILGKKENVVVIEWAEKAIGMYPKDTAWLIFSDMGGDKRKISVGKP